MNNSKTKYLTQASLIAALYVVLTFISALFGMANGAIQLRLSEMLCFLPVYTSAAIPGLAIGCLISNLITGALPLDILFGTLATLFAAMCARLLKSKKYLSVLPNIIFNTIVVSLIIAYVYSSEGSLPYFILTVGIGEVISSGILGTIAIYIIEHKNFKFSK